MNLERYEFLIYLILILSVLVGVIILYFRQRMVNYKLILIQEQLKENERIKDFLSEYESKALQSIVRGRESQRKWLAHYLHDHFGSLLATIKVNINGIDEDAIPNHEALTRLIDQACDDIRNTSYDLNMGVHHDFGLVTALKELVEHISESLHVEYSATMDQDKLQLEDEITIYKIVQGLVSNVLKHAQASKLSISLTYFEEENLMNILVNDNGKGFDMDRLDSKRADAGLNSLMNLVTDLNGEISFDSNLNRGTTVIVDLPISPPAL